MVLHPALLGEPNQRTPEVFFGKVCPEVLKLRHRACRALGGSVTFALGPGASWTVDLGECMVRRGDDPAADLRLELSRGDFIGILKGNLQIVEVYSADRLQVAGDIDMLLRLSIVFGD